MCITVVAVIRRRRKVLLGHVTAHRRWMMEWMTTFQVYSPEELEEAYSELRLPCAYLREGEHPDDALARIMREQLKVKRYTTSARKVFSWYSLSTEWYPGKRHWDLLFAYKVKAQLPAKSLPWWRDLRWVDPITLRDTDFSWNRELMRSLGLVKR